MSLRDRILRYFKSQPDVWIPSSEIERLTVEKTHYIASNASRRCRELHEEGLLQRELRPSGHPKGPLIVWYRFNPKDSLAAKMRGMEAWWNSI